MAHEIVQLKNMHPTVGYSHVARAGNMLFLAGQIAKDVDGNLVGTGDVAAQARQVFTNIKTILEECGGGLENIVKMTTFLTRLDYFETYRSVRSEFFQEPFPPNTLLIVQSLAWPELMIEIEAIAVLD